MTVHVDIDLSLSQCHAMREVEAPKAFHVPHRGKVEIIGQADTEEDRTAVEQAVWSCPTKALTLKEEN